MHSGCYSPNMGRVGVRSWIMVIVIGFAPAAVTAQPNVDNEADAKEIASYRLTMDGVRKMAIVMHAAFQEQKKDPAYQELARIEAELEPLQKKEEPTDAELQRIEELSTKRQQLKEKLDTGGSTGEARTLDEMAAQLQQEPRFTAALASGGISAREFSKFTLAMFGAAFAASLQKSGMLKELPKEVNPANVTFVLEHEAELQRLQEEMKAFEK
jgi:cytochrome c556